MNGKTRLLRRLFKTKKNQVYPGIQFFWKKINYFAPMFSKWIRGKWSMYRMKLTSTETLVTRNSYGPLIHLRTAWRFHLFSETIPLANTNLSMIKKHKKIPNRTVYILFLSHPSLCLSFFLFLSGKTIVLSAYNPHRTCFTSWRSQLRRPKGRILLNRKRDSVSRVFILEGHRPHLPHWTRLQGGQSGQIYAVSFIFATRSWSLTGLYHRIISKWNPKLAIFRLETFNQLFVILLGWAVSHD